MGETMRDITRVAGSTGWFLDCGNTEAENRRLQFGGLKSMPWTPGGRAGACVMASKICGRIPIESTA